MRYHVFVPVLVIAPVANVRPRSIVPLLVFGISVQKRVFDISAERVLVSLFLAWHQVFGLLVVPVLFRILHVSDAADRIRSTISPLEVVMIYSRCGVEMLPESEMRYL